MADPGSGALARPCFAGGSTVVLTGLLSGGGSVVQPLSVTSTWDHYVLTGFTGITSLQFSNADVTAGLSVDNLITGAAAIPEPGTWGLLGLGLAAMALLRRKVSH